VAQNRDLNEVYERLSQVNDLPSILASAYEMFDAVVLTVRGREDPECGMPSLPLSVMSRAVAARQDDSGESGGVQPARSIAALAGLLANKISRAGTDAAEGADRTACEEAAACARDIRALLGGAADG
jgi:hypothetical protein